MSNHNSPEIPNGIPLGVAQCTLLLLRKAIAERNRTIALGAKTPGLTLWLMPNGDLVYKRSRRGKTKGPQPLLIHTFKAPDQGRIALVSRTIAWIADGNCTALPDLMSEADLADAYLRGFFHAIEDAPSGEKGRLALANITKRKLLEKQLAAQSRREAHKEKP